MKLTLGDCRATIARVLNVTSASAQVVTYLNEATQRLLYKGKWPGTYMRYRICVNDGCITWPRQIETIEAIAIGGSPASIRNGWFEFYPMGPGIESANCSCTSATESCSGGALGLKDRMSAVAFDDIIPSGKKIRVYADLNEAVGSQILLQGYDDTGNWILTNDGATNGELVTISTTPQDTVNYFSALTGVQKPVTNGSVRLYELTEIGGALKALAVYEPDETRPEYRRSLVTGLCASDDGTCDKTSVEVMAKLRFIPVANDTDWVMIGNLPALKCEVMAILKEERNLIPEAAVYSAKAVELLRDELKHWMGDGATITLKVAGDNTYAAAGMSALI